MTLLIKMLVCLIHNLSQKYVTFSKVDRICAKYIYADEVLFFIRVVNS